MRKTTLGVMSVLLALAAHAEGPAPATIISQAQVAAVLKQMPPQAVDDQQIRMVRAGSQNVGVGVVARPQAAPQIGIEHDKLTEVYYVLEGAGTLVTGGILVDAKPLPPTSDIYKELTGPSSIGKAIQGGESCRIGAGDVVIIPAGLPHWFSEVQGSIKYLVVRVDPERVLTTK
jgi:uncharacterized RmlC-like cupin family protein